MSNPYEILNVSQDADKGEIMKAQMLAMKEKKFSLQEIAIAVRQLLDPSKRLAADFMFPTKIKSRLYIREKYQNKNPLLPNIL